MTQPTDATEVVAVESARDSNVVKIKQAPPSPRDDEAHARKLARLEAGRAKAHSRKRKKKHRKRARPQPPPLRDNGPDQLVPDVVVCAELSVSRMCLWRWSHLPQYRDLHFPPPVEINGRNYRSRRALEQWKQARIAGGA